MYTWPSFPPDFLSNDISASTQEVRDEMTTIGQIPYLYMT